MQLAKGQKATVTVSGLNELPDIAEMEEMGALTADALKVLHQKDDNTVEKLDVVSYENGTLTFETSSFSPFVIALEYPDQGSEDFDSDGIEIVSIEIDGVEYPNVNDGIATISSIQGDTKVPVGATITLRSKNGKSNYYHNWRIIEGENCAEFVGATNGKGDTYKTVRLKLTSSGKVKVRHDYGEKRITWGIMIQRILLRLLTLKRNLLLVSMFTRRFGIIRNLRKIITSQVWKIRLGMVWPLVQS